MSISTLAAVFQKGSVNRLVILVVSLIPAFLFFPFPDSVFDVGLDQSLSFVFTYLMQGRADLGKDIVFPHGPFAFIMYPLPGDSLWWIAIGFTIIIRLAWAYSLMKLVSEKPGWRFFIAFAGTLVLSAVVGLLLIIVQLVVLLLLNYLQQKRLYWLLSALVLTAFAFYIKAFVGILCLSVVFPFFLVLLYNSIIKLENPWRLVYILVVPFSILAIWLALYRTSNGLLRYIEGMQQLASDNSAAASLYPDNNWIWLAAGMLAGLILIITNLRNSKLVRYFILIGPALFAVWKYSMARQDFFHALTLIIFLFFVLLIFHLLAEKFRIYHLLLSLLILGTFSCNFILADDSQNKFALRESGFPKLISAAMDYQHFSDSCNKVSLQNIERKKLSPGIRSLILNKTVDIYPWEYSYVPANNLNWQPRPVLHSYASYTRFLDNLNAKHFKSKDAPEFLIWELQHTSSDIHGGRMGSIDGRYLLNDEPDMILNLISNYRLIARQEGDYPALIYTKRPVRLQLESSEVGVIETTWNTWFNVPDTNGLISAEVLTNLNSIGRLKGMFYKDDDVYAYYMFSDGSIKQYRVVPRTIKYGLWINPVIMNPELKLKEPRVVKMCFRSRNEKLTNKKIHVTFKRVTTAGNQFPETDSSGIIYDFFGISGGKKRSTLLVRNLAMDSDPFTWSTPVYGPDMHSDKSGQTRVLHSQSSYGFFFDLDSLKAIRSFDEGIAIAQVWIKAATTAKTSLILSVDKDGKSLLYKSIDTKYFIKNEGDYNLVTCFLNMDDSLENEKGLTLRAYLWNVGSDPVSLKNFTLRVQGVLH